jgi:two-component sensor histidine kinase
MKTGLSASLRFTDRVGFRMGMMLTVALLPLGMIAVFQTWRMADQAGLMAEAALTGRTSEAATRERAIIQTALGAASILADSVARPETTVEACKTLMTDLVGRSPIYVYAGYINTEGHIVCSSGARTDDVSKSPTYLRFTAKPGPTIVASGTGAASGRAVLAVSQPVARAGVLLGQVVLSIPQEMVSVRAPSSNPGEGADLLLFDVSGNLLTATGGLDKAAEILPADHSLAELADMKEDSFRGLSAGGEERVFSVVTVVPGLVQALGSWKPGEAMVSGPMTGWTALLFPLMMWVVSLGVAWFAVWRLVIRHIRELRGQMRRFALGKRDTPPAVLRSAPGEIAEVSQTFHNLVRILIRDEAALEASVEEKTVLLKEVHHRVKNNLQLIASIINMQVRNLRDPNAKRVLKSVQDRVASLATIHRNLYQAEQLAAVPADQLVGDIVNQMAVASLPPGSDLRVETELRPQTLYPDQAVPLALLATEAFTNAIKYAVAPRPGEAPWVKLRMHPKGKNRLLLEITNSLGPDGIVAEEREDSTGLGSQLIEAFSSQLDAELHQGIEEGVWRVQIIFELEGFEAEA